MDELKVVKVKLNELEAYCSRFTTGIHSVVPLSQARMKSYLANPNSLSSDVALYTIESKKQIVAFRSIWADVLHTSKEPVRFGWCSGNWVHPSFRRKGLSLKLLDVALSDWEGKLMFTNYAPESLNAYMKSGHFSVLHERTGKRFYLKSNYSELLSSKVNNKLLGKFAAMGGKLLSFYGSLKAESFVTGNFSHFDISIDTECPEGFFENIDENTSLFRRSKEVYDWIFRYPWITETEDEDSQYPFSSFKKSFQYYFITIKKSQFKVSSMLISECEGKVKLLYSIHIPRHEGLAMQFLAKWCAQQKIETLTILDPELAASMHDIKNPFLFSKAFTMNIYSSFDVEKKKNTTVFDADGDYIFT